jgi:lipopolysaccharide heptosyltransferase I
MKILIVKLSSIGDVIHTLPVLPAIRRALPEAQISWVVERRAAEILRDNLLLNDLIEVDTKKIRNEKGFLNKFVSAQEHWRALRRANFDVAIDFQGLLKSALIANVSGAKRRVGFDRAALREPASRFLLTETIKIDQRSNIIKKNLQLAEMALQIAIPANASDFEFPIAVSAVHEREADKVVDITGKNFAILNPSGGWETKLWDAARFGELADSLWKNFALKTVVPIGPGEETLVNRMLSASRSGQVFPVRLSLKGFYALAKQARVYVGGDTGPTHLAVAANAPVVGIFGPTEWWRNGSPRPDDLCVERQDIGCRENCHRRQCGNWICMNIEVQQVLQTVEKRLRSTQSLVRSEKFEVVST